MKHYNYQSTLQTIWKSGVERYESGKKTPDALLNDSELQFLSSIGLNKMDLFDYVEDFVLEGVPSWSTFATICDIRRSYFLEVQKGVFSTNVVEANELPAKTDEIEGIRWLPRIIPKALGKLRGELCPDIMYCCGGDRNFLETNDIHPAEFLRIVWQFEDNPNAIMQWVKARIST
jgi:hypothetical protein